MYRNQTRKPKYTLCKQSYSCKSSRWVRSLNNTKIFLLHDCSSEYRVRFSTHMNYPLTSSLEIIWFITAQIIWGWPLLCSSIDFQHVLVKLFKNHSFCAGFFRSSHSSGKISILLAQASLLFQGGDTHSLAFPLLISETEPSSQNKDDPSSSHCFLSPSPS